MPLPIYFYTGGDCMCDATPNDCEKLDATPWFPKRFYPEPQYNNIPTKVTCHGCHGSGWVDSKYKGAQLCPVCSGEGKIDSKKVKELIWSDPHKWEYGYKWVHEGPSPPQKLNYDYSDKTIGYKID